MNTDTHFRRSLLLVTICLVAGFGRAAEPENGNRPAAVEQEMFGTLQKLKGERAFGQVGVTGLSLRIYPELQLQVEEVIPDTPAAGKFTKGEVIRGVNGTPLEGNNPFIILGRALTAAEATDGQLRFDVQTSDGKNSRQVKLTIPVLGAYSETWPINCKKSDTIVQQAAEFYATTRRYPDGSDTDRGPQRQTHGIGGALACLFLLSTGDDKYLPRVKDYVDHLAADIDGIGNNTWNNGYNGIVCAEYYLRTGDKSVLPVLQYYCDDARDRQFFGVGWGHWGTVINPRYVGGGLMNPAGTQVLTTLLLASECGVRVDQKTLIGALRQWYRFAGHGTVPYGDHRAEGGLGSNGKDGMTAAAMQAACDARGDVGIYRQARNYLSMSTLTSYPKLATGHADQGRGDGIWRGLASAYMLDRKPEEYHAVMKHLQWWYDLSRRPGGGFGMATAKRFDDIGSGAGLALTYTAPRKTLRITGAPHSKHAADFTLPSRLWGRPADQDFLRIEHGNPYHQYGEAEPVHIPLRKFGNAYSKPEQLNEIPRTEMLKNVYHRRYMIRAQAAKALRQVEAYEDLEKLLQDADPRVRRAALDGLIDYRYWFAMGKKPIATKNMTSTMIKAILHMLEDPDEAWYVVDGALMALSRAPSSEIGRNLSLVLPWTTHEEWWLRQSSFIALSGAAEDDTWLPKVLPTMLDMMVAEYRTQARQGMQNQINRLLRKHKPDSAVGRQILDGLLRATRESEIKPGRRAGEGAFNVIAAAKLTIQTDPSQAPNLANIIKARFDQLETRQISGMIDALLDAYAKLPPTQRQSLLPILYDDYRAELIRRMEDKDESAPLGTLLTLTQLQHPDVDWHPIGSLRPERRNWKFTSFDPQPEDKLPLRIGKRFRDVALPKGMDGWYKPDFDASAWNSGRAPIGKGRFQDKRKTKLLPNNSRWRRGEFILMRTYIHVPTLDYDFYRLRVLAKQGFHIYLNGHKIHTYIWWKGTPHYRPIGLGLEEVKHLKQGSNLLAVYANTGYVDKEAVGQIDCYLEGLKKADLLQTEKE